jgi:O-antigen/teichoic acid export membrane protein
VQKILSNTAFNILGIAANSVMALVVTPMLASYLGRELFGVWALFGIVLTASQMLDFGLSKALVRNIAHYRQRDGGQASTRISTAPCGRC